MFPRHWLVPGVLTLTLALGSFTLSRPDPTVLAEPPDPQQTTTLDDQNDLAITVYNSNIALVRDVRTIRLQTGISDLQFMDIAATVNPATVHLRSLTQPALVRVLEQNYEYDLLEPDKLLRKYVGRDVSLVRTFQDANGTREEVVTARLLSYNNAPVWQIGDEIITGLRADHVRFPEVPGNLFSRPTLIWTLDNQGGGEHRVEASYLATDLSWNADYVLTVDRNDAAADLDGWVTLRNGSGTAFPNARLQLVAGELNRVGPERRFADALRERASADEMEQMVQESFSDYHLYTMGRRTSINNNQTKQVALLGASRVPVRKRYVVNGQAFYYRNAQSPGAPIKDPVQVFYEFSNAQKGGLGVPMPAGAVRVYQADSSGGLQFVGEDRIDHTPKDETLNVKIGNAFDVVCERKQTDFEKIASNVYEMEFEITFRNHKTSAVSIEVNEPVGGTWRMIRSSHNWTKSAAWASRFDVPVDADGEAILRYRVRVTY